MRLFLHDGPAHLQILPRHDVREFRDAGAAREFLRPLLADPGNRAEVRGAVSAAATWSDEELLEQLALRVVSDGLQIVSCFDSYLGSLHAASAAAAPPPEQRTTPLQDEDAALEERAAAPGPEETHFLEIELLDEEGKPVANEAYFIELPDGSTISGRTGADGKARIDGIDPGTARVSFPDRDQSAYAQGGS